MNTFLWQQWNIIKMWLVSRQQSVSFTSQYRNSASWVLDTDTGTGHGTDRGTDISLWHKQTGSRGAARARDPWQCSIVPAVRTGSLHCSAQTTIADQDSLVSESGPSTSRHSKLANLLTFCLTEIFFAVTAKIFCSVLLIFEVVSWHNICWCELWM